MEQRSSLTDTIALPERRDGRVLTSALRCLRLLETVAASDSPVGVSELARRLKTSRGAVHLQLATLLRAGWVERVDGGRYRLTLRPLALGQAALEQADLGSRVLPIMEDLAHSTGEAVSLSVLDRGSALIIQRVESGHVLRTDLRVGTRMPLRETASGRVLIASAAHGQSQARPGADASSLPSEDFSAHVRSLGYAVSIDEYIAGISAVAAPVFDARGGVLALSVAGPTARFDPPSVARQVVVAAQEVTARLGGRR